ncbi:MAG: hypothetical protein KJZ98_13320 [Burkholderiaceae bacterium]|jgi:hypothetical protein|nr:hypothetical protein [Burkholderiaceae bacterium]MEB2351613.1 hypothetical protein [Burkholderiaceae bacterium]
MVRKRIDVHPLSAEESAALTQRVDMICRDFKGQFDELEAALGMMLLGRLVGWKVLALIHNKRTIRKYEQILGINIREAFPEEGPLAHKSLAYQTAKAVGKYWKAVSGDEPVPNRRVLSDG